MIMRKGSVSSASEMSANRNSSKTTSYATNSMGFFARKFEQIVRWAAQYGVLAAVEKYYAQKASCQIGSRFE